MPHLDFLLFPLISILQTTYFSIKRLKTKLKSKIKSWWDYSWFCWIPQSRSRISSFTKTSPQKQNSLVRESIFRIAQAQGVMQISFPNQKSHKIDIFLLKCRHCILKYKYSVQSTEYPPTGSEHLLPELDRPGADLLCTTGTLSSRSKTHIGHS